MFKTLSLAIVLLVITGCGTAPVPTANKDISKRPSLTYRVDSSSKLPQKYPLKIAVLPITDSRAIPFYGNEDFFQQNDIDGITKMAYFELKNSHLFSKVKLLKAKTPAKLSKEFLEEVMQKNDVDMVFIANLTEFSLLRTKKGNWRIAPDTYEVEIEMGLIGQLIYLDGGYIVWSGKASRKNSLLVKTGKLTTTQLSTLSEETLKQVFSDIKIHISKNGKRMVTQ